jgi:hypothetical protein
MGFMFTWLCRTAPRVSEEGTHRAMCTQCSPVVCLSTVHWRVTADILPWFKYSYTQTVILSRKVVYFIFQLKWHTEANLRSRIAWYIILISKSLCMCWGQDVTNVMSKLKLWRIYNLWINYWLKALAVWHIILWITWCSNVEQFWELFATLILLSPCMVGQLTTA